MSLSGIVIEGSVSSVGTAEDTVVTTVGASS